MLETNKPEGAERREREHEITMAVNEHFVWQSLLTGTVATPVDRIFHNGLRITAVAEIKSRDQSLDTFKRWGTGLISVGKLIEGKTASTILGCDFYVIIGTIDHHIIAWQVYDHDGARLFDFDHEQRQTQKHISQPDDTKVDHVALLPIAEADIWKDHTP